MAVIPDLKIRVGIDWPTVADDLEQLAANIRRVLVDPPSPVTDRCGYAPEFRQGERCVLSAGHEADHIPHRWE